MSAYSLSALGALVALGVSSLACADQVLSSRSLSPNGRPVQEIRFGEEPGGNNLRVVIVTNGPTAGTTTLLTGVGAPHLWYDPSQQAPTFTDVIASGTVFSLGGGCRRGNQLDFPFINGNRPQIMRVQNGQATVFPLPITDNLLYDSAECAVSPDFLETWFIYSNRNTNRLSVFVDDGGPNDLVVPITNFPSVKTPFQGGIRPQISPYPGEPRVMSLLFMETDGETRWKKFSTNPFNVDFDCLTGAQVPPPTGFTIPRGARVAGNSVIGDFNDDGQLEFAFIDTTTPGACATSPVYTPAGPVAGTGYNWTEPGAAVSAERRFIAFVYGQLLSRQAGSQPTFAPGPGPGSGGPFDACGLFTVEQDDVLITAVAEALNNFRFSQYWKFPPPPPPPGRDEVFRSSMENPGVALTLLCSELGLSQ